MVRSRCNDGVVLDAEARGFFWYIPDDAPEPLVTKAGAVGLLKKIRDIHEGGAPAFTDLANIKSKYCYLVMLGYCTEIKWTEEPVDKNVLKRVLKTVDITSEGERVIAEKNESRKKTKTNKVAGSFEKGPVKVSAEHTETSTSYKG